MQVHRDGPSHTHHVLVKAGRPFKVRHLFKGRQLPTILLCGSQAEVNCSRGACDSPALVLTGEWCEHSAPCGMASHALAAMLPSHLNWRMHEAFLYYLVFVLNRVLEETCADIHGLGRLHRRRTVGAPYNSMWYRFRLQP